MAEPARNSLTSSRVANGLRLGVERVSFCPELAVWGDQQTMPGLLRALCAALFFYLSIQSMSQAQGADDFLKQMPSAAEIEAAYPLGGNDPVDAAARRAAAFKMVGVVIAESNGRNGAPSNLSSKEYEVYRTYNDVGPSNVREAMGWSPFCAGDKDCERFDSLVLDYMWRNKKKAKAFGYDVRDKLFADKEDVLPDDMRYSNAKPNDSAEAVSTGIALLTLIGGLAAGLFAAAPWSFAREGAITSLGSGVTKISGGMTYNSRNHVAIGNKKLGTTITSLRIDDALGEAMNLGAPVRAGIGWSFWRHWALCVKGPAETVREPFLSFFIQTFLVTPILGAVGFVAAALLGAAVGSGHVSVFSMAFVATYTAGVIVKNLLAWRA